MVALVVDRCIGGQSLSTAEVSNATLLRYHNAFKHKDADMDTRDDNHGKQAGHHAGRWVFGGFAVIALYFLFTEHRAHLFAFLPYLLLAACPLMHMFHHGHHHHGHDDGKDEHGRDLDPNGGSAPVRHDH